MSRVLDVYLQDQFAGQLTQTNEGNLSFDYDNSYLHADLPALSLSLPKQTGGYQGKAVKAFFSGFLPDDIVRHRLAKYLGVSEKNPFALLESIGGECAGAVSLYPHGQYKAGSQHAVLQMLDPAQLAKILSLLKQQPLLVGNDDIRLSLAGAQDKIAVAVRDDQIALAKGASLTTHIIKPPISNIKHSVHNELFCMQLVKRLGIKTPDVEMRMVGDMPYLLIARYDRTIDANGIVQRVHQEDFCQALAILPEMKYQREGGPSLQDCQQILQHVARPAVDQLDLLARVIINYCLGNADAHGKNFSLLYQGKKPSFAPAYDIFCTAVYPALAAKMAMKIGGEYHPEKIYARHWQRLVADTSAAKNALQKQLQKVSSMVLREAIALKKSLAQQNIHSEIFDAIIDVIQKRVQLIRERT